MKKVIIISLLCISSFHIQSAGVPQSKFSQAKQWIGKKVDSAVSKAKYLLAKPSEETRNLHIEFQRRLKHLKPKIKKAIQKQRLEPSQYNQAELDFFTQEENKYQKMLERTIDEIHTERQENAQSKSFKKLLSENATDKMQRAIGNVKSRLISKDAARDAIAKRDGKSKDQVSDYDLPTQRLEMAKVKSWKSLIKDRSKELYKKAKDKIADMRERGEEIN